MDDFFIGVAVRDIWTVHLSTGEKSVMNHNTFLLHMVLILFYP